MGVTGLWTVVQPCARPIKLETLNKKRLAVDASIWIYQFLKAVRDKEGNALRNSHVVGFFRRICKLLFIGILPVFVFDGGAPALKRQTINSRKRRREGRKEDAVRTAGKLLALQMQRAAEEEEEARRREHTRAPIPDEDAIVDSDQLVYVDEIQMTQQEKAQNRKFRKKDQYHLPDLGTSLAEMGGPNDPRIMSLEELQSYARQFDTGEDINVYDFSKIDFESPFFTSLPASDRYNILNAARLRSRLRMGYSKDQLDKMFPNRMEFSRFQIDRVRERNELTQRLMNLNGMNDDGMWGLNGTGRIAGERGREYVLVRNDGVEGGWALGVVSGRDEGQQDKPIDVDEIAKHELGQNGEDEQSDEDFEDVPIEGLNRLPKPSPGGMIQPAHKRTPNRPRTHGGQRRPKRQAVHRIRSQENAGDDAQDTLFVPDAASPSPDEASEGEGSEVQSDDDLQRAIAMSLQQDDSKEPSHGPEDERADLNYLRNFQQKRVNDALSIKDSKANSVAAIARTVNARAARPPTSTLFEADSEDEAERAERDSRSQSPYHENPVKDAIDAKDQQRASRIQATVKESARPKSKTDGPLPFEKLDLGSSLFGKKVEKFQEKTAGGFETAGQKKEEVRPLPPWFVGNPDEDLEAQKVIEKADRDKAKKFAEDQRFQFSEPGVLQRKETTEVIDLESGESQSQPKQVFVIDEDADMDSPNSAADNGESDQKSEPDVASQSAAVTMGQLANAVKINPPNVSKEPYDLPTSTVSDQSPQSTSPQNQIALDVRGSEDQDDEEIEWSGSEEGGNQVSGDQGHDTNEVAEVVRQRSPSRSASPDFEDVPIPDQPDTGSEQRKKMELAIEEQTASMSHVSGLADQNAVAQNGDEEDFGMLSDSEDEDLMRQLEIEAQEHARFAAELNQRTQQQNVQQNIADYERELKQLRSQQKKDRRDADEVTQIMITECQQLLRLFGLPYITAPMEAEAQCAELVRLGLVDGIVTDDSDCFLFGGTRIYKNMFNQAKFVECYLLPDLEKEFDLTRAKLIGIAQLLGSDYTEGLTGIGPVSALEILSEFADLVAFKEWWTGVQEGRIPKSEDMARPFRKKFRKTNTTKIFLPPAFPDPRVELAYLEPEVDSDPSEFQWGVPDLDALRSFLMATIGWSQERTDEVLVPVIRDMNRRQQEGTQSNITKFFTGPAGSGAYAPRVRAAEASKRLGGALERMAERAKRRRDGLAEVQADADADTATPDVQPPKQTRKRKSGAKATEDDDDGNFEEETQPKKARKAKRRPRKAKALANADGESDGEDE
ncbi:hypothetical protein ANO11243_023070 [Dothideomycetidae sp. 11243]|nr:hypothetical protein ANO11243_023070 [fungal sp. No.11243]